MPARWMVSSTRAKPTARGVRTGPGWPDLPLDWTRCSNRETAGSASVAASDEAGQGRAKQRAFCIAALEDGDDLSELRELLRTAGVAVVGQIVQHREKPHPNTYLGPGKLARGQGGREGRRRERHRLRRRAQPAPGAQPRGGARHAGRRPHVDDPRHLRRARPQRRGQAAGRARPARVQHGPDARAVDASRAPRRERRHSPASAPADRASRRSRPTAGWRATASPRCAASSTGVAASRATMRAERERAHLPQIALAGYTNAGKSTLLNRLTGAEVGVRDRLFHTLDPTTRELRVNGRPYLLIDTVGFIRKLPHQVVDAFAATLLRDARGRPHPARRRRLGAPQEEHGRDAARRRRDARGRRRRRPPAPARAQQGRRDRRRAPPGAALRPSRRRCSSPR